MTIKGKKKSYSHAPQTSLYFLSLQSGPLLQVSTRQVSHLPSDPNHCNTKSPSVKRTPQGFSSPLSHYSDAPQILLPSASFRFYDSDHKAP